MTETPWSPEQAAEATQSQRDEAPPVGASLPPDAAARVAGAVPAEVDVNALWAQMQDQMAAMQAQIAQLRAGQQPDGAHPASGTAQQVLELLKIHFAHNPHADGAAVLGAAEDLLDAAGNAVDSGDVSVARELATRFERILQRNHPGPGQHFYYNQAVDMAANHVHDALDLITGPAPRPAAAVSSSQPPVKVISGSVTG